jgi:Holliday junction resolvase RusA-like endonuclease
MTDMGFWKDDALICMESIWKVWSEDPGISIAIDEMEMDVKDDRD